MLSLISSLSAGSVLFLAFLVFTNPRKVNIKGNRWMAFFFVCLFIMLIDQPLFTNKIYHNYPHLLGFESFLIFAIAPALYLSVSHYISLEKKLKKIEYLHFLPTLLVFPLIMSTVLMSKAEKLQIINETITIEYVENDPFTYVLLFQMTLYIVLAIFKLLNHQKNIKLFASDTSGIDLIWLKNTMFGVATMMIFWILEIHLYSFPFFSKISTIGYFVAIYIIGYYVFRQAEIYPFKETEKREIKEIIEETSSGKTQRVSDEELENLKAKLSHLMGTEKLYLDETLSLPKLAEKVEISIHNLSYVLNEGFQENFFQFVNRYRIDEAKSLLLSPRYQQLSMLGIAYESGFSSKTTFNTTFKKITGISPSEFITEFSKEKVLV
jgi:AraC-like DNA-binding protein